jgi:dTDP-4-dehydrorhamnose 3,5-epimerase
VIFSETEIAGAFVIDLERRADERGFFARTFCQDELAARGLNPTIAQENVSYNARRGTLRGLHFQRDPHGETKIVRCTRGGIYDVIVDLRPAGATYKRWLARELTDENRRALYVPVGFAHGFLTLTDDTEVLYLMGTRYAAAAATGYRWNDPAFAIAWPFAPSIVSASDLALPAFPS